MDANGLFYLSSLNIRFGLATCTVKLAAQSQPRFARIAAFDRVLRFRERRWVLEVLNGRNP
jgi:hypothetical protein